ncbi:acetyltransferase [Alphaproteobacteria bacterium KMM 3653]|uniref:Acetyltransferase n=1 Tax=Harenicola maris TaxID=2841044 RepID=A0AAP2G7Z8_9RHOB|nr:acetyltransferase [Harenicola maris]
MDQSWVKTNRAMRPYSPRQQWGRIGWALAHPLFRLSPRPAWGLRRALLRLFGARVGGGARIDPTACITMPWNLTLGEECAVGAGALLYALGPITIGPRATVSQGAHLCAGTHDWRDPARPLLRPPVMIGADAWVCADAFIGPGVTLGIGSIAGARAVVMRSPGAGCIVAGNPARVIGHTDATQ